VAQHNQPSILLIVREPLKPGAEAAYKAIEDEIARACVELKCTHPHLAMESVAGPTEVWWLNEFASDADMRRVEGEFARNRPLMAALEHHGARKRLVTDTPVNIYAVYRAELSRGHAWTLAGARFVVVATSRDALPADGSVFEAPDGVRFVMKPARTRQQADEAAQALGEGARVFAVRPYWGLPANEWVAADPEFWKESPRERRKAVT
jgi:hypothetical protein